MLASTFLGLAHHGRPLTSAPVADSQQHVHPQDHEGPRLRRAPQVLRQGGPRPRDWRQRDPAQGLHLRLLWH
ncbi:hypothetical protein CC85DRAFT_104583 [Cutaneotrichosporon oleaginosum]|uniref:Uncharacterized protein n=1 Tax=Cutaneotrichosporon oleaginosum TaxID=879819 RepID=A0A0J0XL39_9TREE|nr:uncharacterized protein CC85DRAFT_104583 [Cutaneotrichosporon oleaginosum]KLT41831.1 hypothetical protein CC85DRAFT_104583 [Cutaneotrichosporon oleaginosum]TXT14752.1 hypothetical protein COLE_00945 [Cutaneotrichosporon oleaginosum]